MESKATGERRLFAYWWIAFFLLYEVGREEELRLELDLVKAKKLP